MTLGILVATDKYRDDIAGIAEAAVERGHRVVFFFMDEGCRLVKDKKIISLKDKNGIFMSMCDYNRNKMGIAKEYVPEGVVCGSQYDNAAMNRESDKLIVF
jgi:predicted peroxiredoxin